MRKSNLKINLFWGVFVNLFSKNSRVGDLKKVFFDRVSKASTTPHKNWAFGSCKKTLDCRSLSGGQTGRLRFSELMVKWHVNDRERPRGTHLGLRYNAWNLKVNLGLWNIFFSVKKSFFTEIQNEKWKRGNKIGKKKS